MTSPPVEPPTPATAEPAARRSTWRPALVFLLPSLLALGAVLWPLIGGSQTLVLRDVLLVHWQLKASQELSLEAGELPLIDVARAGGQPLTGNPNAVPFYPDNLLYPLAPGLWALNAHFWIHLLLAPFAVYWMGRAWGASRPASWVAGVVYATSGYVLAHLNFYNLIAGVALAPALVAALLTLPAVEGRRRGWVAVATALLWALLLVAGEPSLAAMAAVLAGSAMVARHGWRLGGAGPAAALTGAVTAGTLLALPQLVELLRILPDSWRGFQGYAGIPDAVGSWHPLGALEWLVPFVFGRFDLIGPGGFWGYRFHGMTQPYYLSLFPGYLALVLVLAAGRPRSRAAWWGWGMVGAGLFLVLGSTNPLAAWLFDLEAAALFRYPVKLWLLVALGATVLVALGFDRLFVRPERPRVGRFLALVAGLGLLVGAFLAVIVLAAGPVEAWMLASRLPERTGEGFAVAERQRWIATAVACLVVLAGMALAGALARRRPRLGPALLVLLATVAQLYLLAPLARSDRVEWYTEPSPVASVLPADALVVHGAFSDVMASPWLEDDEEPAFPDSDYRWFPRHAAWQLYPFAGVPLGLRYDLSPSPEGLDSYLVSLARRYLRSLRDDELRVRLLRHWGVTHLIMVRPWADPETRRALPDDAVAGARPVGRFEALGDVVRVHELVDPAPPVLFAEHVLRAPEIRSGVELLGHPRFDPRRHVLLPGTAGEGESAPGAVDWERIADPSTEAAQRAPAVRLVSAGDEALEIVTDSPVPGVVVVNRSHLALWTATVDGEPVPVEIANLYRMGVPVPAGEHRVRLWVDRGPFRASLAGAALGLVLLLALPWVVGRRSGGRQSGGRQSGGRRSGGAASP